MNWLEKIIPQSTKINVTLRYLTAIVGTIVSTLATLNLFVSPEQAKVLIEQVNSIGLALGSIATAAVMIYGVVMKNSKQALDVADQVDKGVLPNLPEGVVVIAKTPEGIPDLKVPAK
jgi:hypothetical protein